MSYHTPLGKVRGLGSAKSGTHHWIHQRFTAVALLVLTPWLLWALTQWMGQEYEDVVVWIGTPFHAIFLGLYIFAAFFHAKLGLQVVIEDYIQCHKKKIFLLILMNFAIYGLCFTALFSLARLAFMGMGDFAG
jgi:succinate dehydrogenase / fumarate reductase, membrane anchor subunit